MTIAAVHRLEHVVAEQQIWPWDEWLRSVASRGVTAELAQLGRDVLRDHTQHGKEGWLIGNPDYLAALCLAAPITAEYECFEALTWWNSDRDGAQEAFIHLAGRLGGDDAAQAALDREEPAVEALRALFAEHQQAR